MHILKKQSGFVLASTIILLTIITIAASVFALWAERRIEASYISKTETRLALDRFSTLNALLYILSTGQMEPRGVRFLHNGKIENNKSFLLKLDNRPYRGYGDIIFTIQDESGLLGINFFDAGKWNTLLTQFTIPPEQRGSLLAKLQDYTDPNDSFHLNGAERLHYQEAGRVGPPNRQLLTSRELINILDWDKYPDFWKNDKLPRLTTACFTGPINIHFAGKEILQTLPGITLQDAEFIIHLREKQDILNLPQLEKILGKKLPALNTTVLFMPSSHQRITLYDTASKKAEEFHLELMPLNPLGIPWRMGSKFLFSLHQQDDTVTAYEDIPFFEKTMATHQ